MSSVGNAEANLVVDGRTAGCNCTCDRDRHLFCSGPKRMLALDGGGVRGAITVAFLEQIERVLSERLEEARSSRQLVRSHRRDVHRRHHRRHARDGIYDSGHQKVSFLVRAPHRRLRWAWENCLGPPDDRDCYLQNDLAEGRLEIGGEHCGFEQGRHPGLSRAGRPRRPYRASEIRVRWCAPVWGNSALRPCRLRRSY